MRGQWAYDERNPLRDPRRLLGYAGQRDDAAPVAEGHAHRLGPFVREPGQGSSNELAVFCGGEGSKCVADLFQGSAGGFADDAVFVPGLFR